MRNQKPIEELQEQVDYLIKRDQEELATLRAELNALKQTQARQSKLRRRVGFVAMLSLVLGSGLAMAVGTFSSNTAVPATIPYEGYLEIGGVAVDGNRNMQFELLHCTSSDVATCQPDAAWDSGVVPVSVSAGRFATLLGDETHDADTYTLANHGLFVRISVDAAGDGGALTKLGQLQQIHSVPFAANAVVASKAEDFDVSGTMSASSATVNGALSAGSASIAGDLNTANARISGILSAESASIADGLNVNNATMNGTVTANVAVVQNKIEFSNGRLLVGVVTEHPLTDGGLFGNLIPDSEDWLFCALSFVNDDTNAANCSVWFESNVGWKGRANSGAMCKVLCLH